MQGIIAVLVFGLIILAITVLVIVNFTYKGLRQMRQAAEDRAVRKQKQKEQKEKNPFGDDYFKSSNSAGQQRTHQQYQPKASQEQKATGQQEQKEATARRTTTSSGVTIIDDRNGSDKKIFDHNDGEYVEFEEV